jgi:hypothetical protein
MVNKMKVIDEVADECYELPLRIRRSTAEWL